ncbi:MAG: prephenate dehydrogenase [Solirubrobacteraceae bacterium]|nr:prephenate dehydrogenase [Solirubrobacteraceae bacterium]
MTIGVVGLGLIGGSLMRALGGRGYDADPAARAAAVADGFRVVETPAGLAGCELVLVAVPPGRTAEVVREVLDAVPGAAVADTASVKAPVVEALAGTGERFVGAHPLAGAETSGWAASSADIVRGATWAICPVDEGASLEPAARLAAAVDALGGRLVACTAADHDDAVARTSHAPHLAATALAGLAAGGLRAQLAGTGFRDMTRVARADAALWTEILGLNRDRTLAALDELTGRIAVLRDAVADPAALEAAWAEGGAALAELDAAREPQWHETEIAGGWAGLLALGRPLRRLSVTGADGTLRAEVAG